MDKGAIITGSILTALAATFGYAAMHEHALGGKTSDPTLQGVETRRQIFKNGPDNFQHVTVNSRALKSGHSYNYNGAVTITGDIAPDVTLHAIKIEVLGNVGEDSYLDAEVPIVSKKLEAKDIDLCRKLKEQYPGNVRFIYRIRRYSSEGCFFDSPVYPQETGAAIKVTGTVKTGAALHSNYGAEIGCTEKDVTFYTNFHRPVIKRCR